MQIVVFLILNRVKYWAIIRNFELNQTVSGRHFQKPPLVSTC